MRIPHHLSRSSTGCWSFVQRVPTDLQAVLDCRLIKRTLKTCNPVLRRKTRYVIVVLDRGALTGSTWL